MKPICLIQSPLATRSGYGDAARDIARHIIELDVYDVILVSLPWGSTPMTALDPVKDAELIKRIATIPVQLPRQPELYIQVSIPSEFQPVGKYNIGITAGIETNVCSLEWLEGCNRMDVIWCMSNHAKNVFQTTTVDQRNQQGQTVRQVKLERPIDVLHNCVNLGTFHPREVAEIPKTIRTELQSIPEEFVFLFVGHWLKGNVGEDRKNVGLLVKIFCEVFKDMPSSKRPALLLKTSGAGFSHMDHDAIMTKIQQIRASVTPNPPNVYLLHGDLTDEEMSGLYNHPKVKAHVNFTKGEGFCRPLLEATTSKKPIIASGWSGHLDFLDSENAILLNGTLTKVDPSVVWPGVIIEESSWFSVDTNMAATAMMAVYRNYDKFLPRAETLYKKTKENFAYPTIKARTKELLDKYAPQFQMVAPLSLPKLKKISLNT
jgi:glycosyltransferase involved in cell wall biosynthesis